MVRLALPCALLSRGHGLWEPCQPLCQCHGKCKALIFVLDCSSPIFTTAKFRLLCSHQLGREVLREDSGRRLSQQPGDRTWYF